MAFVKQTAVGIGMRINVRVTPNSRVCNVSKAGENSYIAKVDAPATEGKANKRLIEAFADYFGVPKGSVAIIKGSKNRNKIVEIME